MSTTTEKTVTTFSLEIMDELKELQDCCDIEIRSYSGRNMYGRQCLGVETNNYLEFLMVFGAILERAGECPTDGIYQPSLDNMGVNNYIVYFPLISYVESDFEDSSEEDENN
jgi:hypothetical protein